MRGGVRGGDDAQTAERAFPRSGEGKCPVPGGGARPASVPEYSRGWGGLQLPPHIRCTFFEVRVWCTRASPASKAKEERVHRGRVELRHVQPTPPERRIARTDRVVGWRDAAAATRRHGRGQCHQACGDAQDGAIRRPLGRPAPKTALQSLRVVARLELVEPRAHPAAGARALVALNLLQRYRALATAEM